MSSKFICSLWPLSLPPREAWIEIMRSVLNLSAGDESLPPREAWIEIVAVNVILAFNCRFPRGKRGLKLHHRPRGQGHQKSLPPREAWIEMLWIRSCSFKDLVASPAGSVD